MLNGKQRINVEALLSISDAIGVDLFLLLSKKSTNKVDTESDERIQKIRRLYRIFLNDLIGELQSAHLIINTYKSMIKLVKDSIKSDGPEYMALIEHLGTLYDQHNKFKETVTITDKNGNFEAIDLSLFLETVEGSIDEIINVNR